MRLLITSVALMLSGCDLPGMGPDPRIALREAEARAIGSACRHGLRGLEDCYDLHDSTSKAAIFAGWKEMDEYMRDNKIVGIPVAVAKPAPEETVIEEPKATIGANVRTSADAHQSQRRGKAGLTASTKS